MLVDKPAGWTSFDVVNYVRKIVATAEGKKPKNVKVGHTGTLDPFATGLLVLLVGKEYTKRAGEFSKLDKTYEVTMRLGETSTTGDPEGIISPYNHPANASLFRRSSKLRQDLMEATQKIVGEIEQVPPAYSAIKIDGQRAYKLAREGKEVKIEPRKVTIHAIKLISYDYPEVKLIADVSSGTYIRTLVEDIGKTLGTGAYTTALRRTKVGAFEVEKALKVENISTRALERNLIS